MRRGRYQHARAMAVFEANPAGNQHDPVFTSRYVLAELVTVLLYREKRVREQAQLIQPFDCCLPS